VCLRCKKNQKALYGQALQGFFDKGICTGRSFPLLKIKMPHKCKYCDNFCILHIQDYCIVQEVFIMWSAE